MELPWSVHTCDAVAGCSAERFLGGSGFPPEKDDEKDLAVINTLVSSWLLILKPHKRGHLFTVCIMEQRMGHISMANMKAVQ